MDKITTVEQARRLINDLETDIKKNQSVLDSAYSRLEVIRSMPGYTGDSTIQNKIDDLDMTNETLKQKLVSVKKKISFSFRC